MNAATCQRLTRRLHKGVPVARHVRVAYSLTGGYHVPLMGWPMVTLGNTGKAAEKKVDLLGRWLGPFRLPRSGWADG